MQSLVLQKTPVGIKAALDAVPATLEQTYCNILLRIPKEDREIAKQAFLWLACSIRALEFDELCEAVVVDERHAGVNEEARLLQPEDLLHICSSLIDYNEDKQTVVLAHSSVLLYLTSQQIRDSEVREFYINPDTAHVVLTRKCVSYLCSDSLGVGYCDTIAELDSRWDDWPLLEYAVRSWPKHAQLLDEGDIDDFTKGLLLQFFETARRPRCGNFGAWVQAFLPFALLSIDHSTPLYYASRFGLNTIVKMILAVQGTGDLELRGGRRGSTPLHAASAFGSVEVIETLLAAGANAQEVNEEGECGLQWAVLYGSSTKVRLLLSAGSDPNFRNRRGHTPLYYSVRNKQKGCSIALLEAGADPENIDGKGSHAGILYEKRDQDTNINWAEILRYK